MKILNQLKEQGEFFKLYDYIAVTVKDAFLEAEIGGNAVINSQPGILPFLFNFIRPCFEETNYQVGSPMVTVKSVTFDCNSLQQDNFMRSNHKLRS